MRLFAEIATVSGTRCKVNERHYHNSLPVIVPLPFFFRKNEHQRAEKSKQRVSMDVPSYN